ncbi:ROK family protein [Klebsiella oxytoca]|uniref:ROK family protein n=1 Tax=Klebsiella oxytoca TaxID=571 RepID=UPI00157A8EA8|nr:ROK family transcriptional regulator [Klebsiella oxytoca]
MQRTGFNNARVRQANKSVFLSHLWRAKQLSKSQLSQLSGLSIPAVSNILDELLSDGLISHSSEKMSNRGVNSGSFQIPQHGAWTLCMNITPTSIEYQLADARLLATGPLQHVHIDAPTPQALLAAIAGCWQEVHRQYPQSRINLALGVHGQVDPVTGVSQTMPQARWKTPVELKYLLEEKLRVRVMVDNDCVMLALAEKWQNDGHPLDFCVINVDYGIGSSFVINDQVWRGSLYGSGQIGHTIVNPDGMACDCGRYGCLETVASLSALKKQARTWLKTQPDAGPSPENITTESLMNAWRAGDMHIRAWADSAANAIGLSLYNFLNILNINQIWLYGRSCAFGETWLNTIVKQTGFNPFDHGDSPRTHATQIGFGRLSRQQQLLGIGYLYVEEQLQALR